MNKFKMRLAAFMNGRYGYDSLGRLLIGVSIACLILSFITFENIFYYAGLVLLLFCYYRMFSKNITKRYSENSHYVNIKNKIFSKFKSDKRRIKERKTYRFFKCSQCAQTIRIPKGKGNICITCPKCRNEFLAKT